jgi:hypothetical protein
VFEGLPDVFASYMLDSEGLRRYAGAGPINTDDNQRITFDAASAAQFQGTTDFYRTVASILPYRRAFPDEFVQSATPEAIAGLRQRVGSYGEAATHYLAAEVRLVEGGNRLSEAAFAEFLEAYKLDVRFTSAPRRLLELAARDSAAAPDIVRRLWIAHPEAAEIARLYEEMNGVPAARK